jgi:hypothetical protein
VLQSTSIEKTIISAVKNFAATINARSKVVADMSELANLTIDLPLANFDYWEKLIRTEFTNALNDQIKPKLAFWSRPKELLTWLDIISWDGYRREKTLRTISGAAPNAFFFSLVLRRLNDWVPQVRTAAREKLPELAKSTAPIHVVEAICVSATNWHSWGRIESVDKEIILQIMQQDSLIDLFKKKLISSISGPMATLFSQLGRTNILDKYIEEIASLAKQPFIRAKAYRCLFERKMSWSDGVHWEWTDKRYCQGHYITTISERKLSQEIPINDLLIRASADRSSIVRRVAAEFLIKELDNLGETAIAYANTFSIDTAKSVSERGLFALKLLREIEA